MADSHRKKFNLLKNISRTSYIGEIGLYFSKEGISTKDIQVDTFYNKFRFNGQTA